MSKLSDMVGENRQGYFSKENLKMTAIVFAWVWGPIAFIGHLTGNYDFSPVACIYIAAGILWLLSKLLR